MTQGTGSMNGGRIIEVTLAGLAATAYLCPEAEIEHTLAPKGSIGVDLDDLPFPVARDDVHFHPKVICNRLRLTHALLSSLGSARTSWQQSPYWMSSVPEILRFLIDSSLIEKKLSSVQGFSRTAG